MTHLEVGIYIHASEEKVWEFLSDLPRRFEWLTSVGQVLSGSQDPPRVGTVYKDTPRIGGPWKTAREWRITEFDPPKQQTHQGKWPRVGTVLLSISLEPAGQGTLLKLTVDVSYSWYLRPLAWLMMEGLYLRRTAQTSLRRSVAKAKALIEGREEAVV